MRMNNYLILSNDKVTINTCLNEIIKKEKLDNADVIKYDLSESLLENAVDELNTYGFFSENKVVVLTSCFFISRDKKRGELERQSIFLENKQIGIAC